MRLMADCPDDDDSLTLKLTFGGKIRNTSLGENGLGPNMMATQFVSEVELERSSFNKLNNRSHWERQVEALFKYLQINS